MPRKAKEKIELDLELTNQETEKKVTTKPKKTPTSKKSKTKKETTEKSVAKDTVAEKKTSKKASPKETVAKKKTSKKASSTLKTKSTKKSNAKTSTSKIRKTKKAVEVIEYYDLPYRYNQTVIKLLAQTPKSLFVYWDISDEDRKNFISKYGENFFEITKPVLLIHNETLNYTFELEINDFANSWYLRVNDADCVYKIELGRKYINTNNYQNNIYGTNNSDYIYITSSNSLVSPNDHILFNNLDIVYFKNVKTNARTEKKISDIATIKNIGKIYNIYDLYKKIYSEENIDNFDLKNPSSGLSSSSFKI